MSTRKFIVARAPPHRWIGGREVIFSVCVGGVFIWDRAEIVEISSIGLVGYLGSSTPGESLYAGYPRGVFAACHPRGVLTALLANFHQIGQVEVDEIGRITT